MRRHKKKIGSRKALSLPTATGESKEDANYSVADIDTYWPTQGWNTRTPESQGMDSAVIADTIEAFHNCIQSMVIIRNGYIVAEAYNESTQVDTPQVVFSITKSFLSALLGIALYEKKLNGIDQKLSGWFPAIASDTLKSEIMIKHLLYMTSGLEWNDVNDKSSNEMMYSSNWIANIMEHASLYPSGTKFNYSNGDAHLLSAVMQKAIGESLFNYAKSRLFTPLGMTNVDWGKDPQGLTIGSWGMAMTVRDMAKLGLLYLKEGEWDGKIIIPKHWIKESLTKRAWIKDKNRSEIGYGYLWWLKSLTQGLLKNDNKNYNMFYAAGSWGQRIFVVPGLQLIVAMTAKSADVEMPEQLLNGVIRSILGPFVPW